MPDWFWTYSGDLHQSGLDPRWVGLILVLSAMVCGLLIGAEREFKHKPAGLRTLMLICIGSTVYTIASLQLVAGGTGDRTRIAAQIVTGIGFLGAGAIIRERGNVVGLTTAAAIWVTAAIGILVGGGYAAAGMVLTLMVMFLLTFTQRWHRRALGACRFHQCRLTYASASGKTRIRILEVLDDFEIPDQHWTVEEQDGRETLVLTYCHYHRAHRAILAELVRIEGIEQIDRPRAARKDEHHPD